MSFLRTKVGDKYLFVDIDDPLIDDIPKFIKHGANLKKKLNILILFRLNSFILKK